MTERNEGFIVSGGAINVGGSIVVGSGARAETVVNQPVFAADPEVASRLAALENGLREHAAQLSDHAAAAAGLEALTDELNQPQPSRSRVAQILSSLRDSVGSVAAVLGSIASIEHVLATLL